MNRFNQIIEELNSLGFKKEAQALYKRAQEQEESINYFTQARGRRLFGILKTNHEEHSIVGIFDTEAEASENINKILEAVSKKDTNWVILSEPDYSVFSFSTGRLYPSGVETDF